MTKLHPENLAQKKKRKKEKIYYYLIYIVYYYLVYIVCYLIYYILLSSILYMLLSSTHCRYLAIRRSFRKGFFFFKSVCNFCHIPLTYQWIVLLLNRKWLLFDILFLVSPPWLIVIIKHHFNICFWKLLTAVIADWVILCSIGNNFPHSLIRSVSRWDSLETQWIDVLVLHRDPVTSEPFLTSVKMGSNVIIVSALITDFWW